MPLVDANSWGKKEALGLVQANYSGQTSSKDHESVTENPWPVNHRGDKFWRPAGISLNPQKIRGKFLRDFHIPQVGFPLLGRIFRV